MSGEFRVEWGEEVPVIILANATSSVPIVLFREFASPTQRWDASCVRNNTVSIRAAWDNLRERVGNPGSRQGPVLTLCRKGSDIFVQIGERTVFIITNVPPEITC